MQTANSLLFEVEIRHACRTKAADHNFRITPTPATSEKLQTHKMFFRITDSGFKVFCPAERKKSKTLPTLSPRSGQPGGSLVFLLSRAETESANHSPIPGDQADQPLCYLHNRGSRLADRKLLLSTADGPDWTDAKDRPVYLRPPHFRYAMATINPAVNFQLRDNRQRLLAAARVAVSGAADRESRAWYEVNLQEQPEGRYTLTADGIPRLEFFLMQPPVNLPVFAIAEFYLDNSPLAAYRVYDEEGGIRCRKYTINLTDREAYLQYYIVLKNRKSIQGAKLQLTTPDPSLQFIPARPVTMPGGLAALLFQTSRPVPAAVAAKAGLRLVSTDESNRFRVVNLPIPGTATLKQDLRTAGKYYTQVFYYI